MGTGWARDGHEMGTRRGAGGPSLCLGGGAAQHNLWAPGRAGPWQAARPELRPRSRGAEAEAEVERAPQWGARSFPPEPALEKYFEMYSKFFRDVLRQIIISRCALREIFLLLLYVWIFFLAGFIVLPAATFSFRWSCPPAYPLAPCSWGPRPHPRPRPCLTPASAFPQ